MKTVFLLGYYGQGNVGDDAILSAFFKTVSASDTAFSTLPSGRHENPVLRFFRVARRIRKADGLWLVGGNLLQNETSNRSLCFYLSALCTARLFKKPQTVFGGVGEITGNCWQRLTGLCLSRADGLYLRSEEDRKTARNLCRKANVACPPVGYFPDMALFLPPVPKVAKEYGVLILKKRGNPVPHKKLIALLIKTKKPLWLVGFSSEDEDYLRALGEETGLPVSMPKDEGAVFALFSRAAFAISERYHGGIFSLLSHTPCLLEVSSAKNHGLSAEVERAALITAASRPLFGFHIATLYQENFSLALFAFFQRKIGGISASDFEDIRREMKTRRAITPR